MTGLYPYLAAQLPMLSFGERSPLGFDRLIRICSGLVTERDLRVLRSIPEQAAAALWHPVVREWNRFNIALGNELVRVRCARKKADADQYLRPGGCDDPGLRHLALAAAGHANPQEGERMLDGARWDFLDRLCGGHYLDFYSIIVYGYKLLILARWDRIETADKEQLLQSV